MSIDHFDWIIVGSGFGGAVAALRLAECGARVLVLEKGKRYRPDDFAETNWELGRWLWEPALGLKGIFRMSPLQHVTVLHGVGVGGGSLGYANTLPVPPQAFFEAKSWAHLADWQQELMPHYATARRMLGVTENSLLGPGDRVLEKMAAELGRSAHLRPTEVAVFFGEPGVAVPDPYFGGSGPERVGCIGCGACMTGCRIGAKNSLDQNYLYFAERCGARVEAETEVHAIRAHRSGGYDVVATYSSEDRRLTRRYRAARVVLAAGVMGTLPLLLRMQRDPDGLPRLSSRLGQGVLTNNESLLGVVAPGCGHDFSQGVAITSILHTDEHSHLEPVRYGAGSGFFRLLALPHAPGPTARARLWGAVRKFASSPMLWARACAVPDFARSTQILLYMRTLDQTLRLELGSGLRTGFRPGLVSRVDESGGQPTSFMPPAADLVARFAREVSGVPIALLTETLAGVPTTAHILGGCCMGDSAHSGVIDSEHRVFGYDGLYVIDGSSLSANPGVNPSLTIAALAERAMSRLSA